ncbi:hypothetical protein [Streptomyces abyssomicinicus]|uniref:hypothetical protein n=1 Tax=Streptomyces abyssomicinicus TaxID=574929 RepID=UPI0012503A36|nr:hypothetical protein [Streptomyces abyssomicinicus]
MALHTKGSRRIVVDGTECRRRIRRQATCGQGCCGRSPLTYAVEAAGTGRAGGTVLLVTTGHPRPDNAFRAEAVPVLPADVAAAVRAARAAGWEPGRPGSAFRFPRPAG